MAIWLCTNTGRNGLQESKSVQHFAHGFGCQWFLSCLGVFQQLFNFHEKKYFLGLSSGGVTSYFVACQALAKRAVPVKKSSGSFPLPGSFKRFLWRAFKKYVSLGFFYTVSLSFLYDCSPWNANCFYRLVFNIVNTVDSFLIFFFPHFAH